MSQISERLWSRDQRQIPFRPWYAPLVATLGAIVFFFGSIYSDAIKSAVLLPLDSGAIVWPAVVFWASLVVVATLVGFLVSARNDALRAAIGELKDRSAEVEARLQSLPPRGYLVAFEDLFRVSFDVDSRSDDSEEGLKASIVVALGGIVSLVRAFGSRGDGSEYAINIMVYRPAAQIRTEDLARHVQFVEPGANPNTWEGVLQLRKEFAYRFDHDSMHPDAQIEPMMLAIPEASYRNDNGRSTLLPGAPSVFCDPTKAAGFENTLELAGWCREHLALRPSVADDLERYYSAGEGKAIRSFICMPIVVTPTGGTPVTIGVVNVQSNRPGFLRGDKVEHFIPLATPFVLLIGRALSKYRVVPKAVPAAVPQAANVA